jgi:hypothetical protein
MLQFLPMIKTILVTVLVLSSLAPASAKDKKINRPTVTAGNSQNMILDKFPNCKAAKAAGVSNVPVSPGYTPPGWKRSADADKDGIACEKK